MDRTACQLGWTERKEKYYHTAQILTRNSTVHLEFIKIKGYNQDMGKNEISYMPF